MTTDKSRQTGNISAGIQDLFLYCIPVALILVVLSYIQLAIISDIRLTTALMLFPVILGTAIGLFLVYIKQQGRLLSRKMVIDPLTGTLNRSWFQATRDEIMDKCQKEGRVMSVVIFDIDHFRQVNEVNGYHAGDDVLRQTAQLVTNSLRKSDWLIRWGGEQFIILAMDTPSSGAMTIAERLRKIIASYNYPGNTMITCSFGVAEFSQENDDSIEKFINRAEVALQKAKDSGRNCIHDANDMLTVSAENPELDNQQIRDRNEVPSISTLKILRHARSLLAPAYAKKLLRESVIAALLIFPVLALIKFQFIDGIDVNLAHIFIPIAVAFVIGLLVGNFRILGKAIETQNYQDPLTQAYNRHWIEGFGRLQMQQCNRYGSPLSVALIQIDELKEINSKYGTACGDKIIQHIASAIRDSADESSSLIRWTGQIFMLFMPGIESEQALDIAEQIKTRFAESRVDLVENLQCSIGLTCFIKDEDNELQDLLEKANTALLQAASESGSAIKVA